MCVCVCVPRGGKLYIVLWRSPTHTILFSKFSAFFMTCITAASIIARKSLRVTSSFLDTFLPECVLSSRNTIFSFLLDWFTCLTAEHAPQCWLLCAHLTSSFLYNLSFDLFSFTSLLSHSLLLFSSLLSSLTLSLPSRTDLCLLLLSSPQLSFVFSSLLWVLPSSSSPPPLTLLISHHYCRDSPCISVNVWRDQHTHLWHFRLLSTNIMMGLSVS